MSKGYDVHIREKSTGVVRVATYNDLTWSDNSAFWWSQDGNMGCDCNRYLEFCRANGEDLTVDIDSVECTSGRYDIVKITLHTCSTDVSQSIEDLNFKKETS